MSLRARALVPALLVVAVVVAALAFSGGLGGPLTAVPGSSQEAGSTAAPNSSNGFAGSGDPTSAPTATPVPAEGGVELYGYVPYWQMNGSMAGYLEGAPLSTLALFSVTARPDGALDPKETGYRRITGGIGRRLIEEAQQRGTEVDLVFTSFGPARNGVLFGRLPAAAAASPGPSVEASAAPTPAPGSAAPSLPGMPAPPPWHRTVNDLVALATELGVDGINVDVEQLDDEDRAAYGEFIAGLGSALRAARPGSRLSVATEAGLRGTANAAAAAAAGVDRVFLMGYDYHWSGSAPGGSAPVDRSDGLYSLRWSIDRYVEAGVPRDRILLGLPLYGMSWPTTGPDRTAPLLGKGAPWFPSHHLDLLLDPGFQPGRDPLELAEFFVTPDGDTWRVTYYDSAATLRSKLALARDSGLAGAGFWAMGYVQGVPGYLPLMTDFRDGRVPRTEAPPR